jgi:hypothetical protein
MLLKTDKVRYTAGEVACLIGVSKITVIKWGETKGLCSRDFNNYRVFTPEAVEELREMAGLKKTPSQKVDAEGLDKSIFIITTPSDDCQVKNNDHQLKK